MNQLGHGRHSYHIFHDDMKYHLIFFFTGSTTGGVDMCPSSLECYSQWIISSCHNIPAYL